MKTMGIKCDECGKYFIAGNREDGMPNGIGVMTKKGGVHNVCIDCLLKLGGEVAEELDSFPLPKTPDVNMFRAVTKAYEKKLEELMGKEEFEKFVFETTKQLFLAEVMACPDEEFKKVILENFDQITEDVEDKKKGENE